MPQVLYYDLLDYQLTSRNACVMVTCMQVSWTPACRCHSHLHAGVCVTNLYTLVKHAPRSAVEVFEEAGAHDMDTAQPDGSASGSWAKIRPPGALRGPLGPTKGPFEAQTGPFGGPRSAIEVRLEAQAHDMDAGHPVGPTSDSWAKNRPPRALRGPPGPPKGPFEAQTGPFGVPRSAVEVR